jgi:carotenoid cleavage dioxygenase
LLDDVPTEFPRMDNRVLGRKSRYSYNPRLAPLDTLLFDGFVRYDFETGQSLTYNYPKGCYGGELVFCPREGSEGARDIDDADGYLMTYVVNEATGRSELQIFDAHAINEGPITRAEVRERVPTGFHAWWVDGKDLEGASL